MPKVSDIYALCDSISPFNLQEVWDRSGLNVGSMSASVKHIVLSLELNMHIALSIKPHTLVITHHPLIFKSLNAFDYSTYPSNIAKVLIEKNCHLIAMHTNFDISHLNSYLTKEVLKWCNFAQDGLFMCGDIKPIDLESLAKYVKKQLKAPFITYTQADSALDSSSLIKKVYVVCGSGCSMMSHIALESGVCFITSDVKHHDAMIAKSLGISLIDMGHYESEKYFGKILQNALQNGGYKAIIADCKNPFSIC